MWSRALSGTGCDFGTAGRRSTFAGTGRSPRPLHSARLQRHDADDACPQRGSQRLCRRPGLTFSSPSSVIFGRSIRCRQCRLALVSRDYPGMVCRKNFWRGIHALMLVEERANILGKLPVFRLPGGVQRIGGLLIGTAYLLPAECAGCDERRQLILALARRRWPARWCGGRIG